MFFAELFMFTPASDMVIPFCCFSLSVPIVAAILEFEYSMSVLSMQMLLIPIWL